MDLSEPTRSLRHRRLRPAWLNHWHELTHCYQGLGWKLTKRDILQEDIQDSEHPWEFVVAEFEKVTGETAILVFSTFYEDGSPAEALRIGIDHDWDEKQDLLTTLKSRLTTSESDQSQHTRALQCQSFPLGSRQTLLLIFNLTLA